MRKRTKGILIFVATIAFIYALLAMIEQVNLSSETAEEAFEQFINSEFKTEAAQNEIGDKTFYRIGNHTFTPFEVGNDVAFVQFEKGIFGWKQSYYSREENEAYSYSRAGDERNGETLLHGVIPEDIVTETETIKVNGKDANRVMLNDQAGIWLMIKKDNQETPDNMRIEFLDNDGNIIGKI